MHRYFLKKIKNIWGVFETQDQVTGRKTCLGLCRFICRIYTDLTKLTNTTRTYWSDLRSTKTTFSLRTPPVHFFTLRMTLRFFHTENDSKLRQLGKLFEEWAFYEFITYNYVTPNALSSSCISLSNSRLVTFRYIWLASLKEIQTQFLSNSPRLFVPQYS